MNDSIMTGAVATFAASLDDLDVDLVRTNADDFRTALDPLLTPPVVGAQLPFVDLSLPPDVNIDPTVSDLETAVTGVTAAGLGIADYGSVVIQGGPEGAEPVSLYADTHVAVLAASDLLTDMDAAFDRLATDIRSGNGQAVIATGPSATADMGALVRGAHGPTDVYVVLVEDR